MKKTNSSTSWPDGDYIFILGWPIPLILASILGLHTEQQSDWGNLFGKSNLSIVHPAIIVQTSSPAPHNITSSFSDRLTGAAVYFVF